MSPHRPETEGNNNSKVTKSNTNNKTKTNKKIVGYDWPIGVRYMNIWMEDIRGEKMLARDRESKSQGQEKISSCHILVG